MISVEGNQKHEVIVLAGGFDGGRILSSVEVYSPEGRCNFEIDPLPEPRYGLTVQYMNDDLFACGGHKEGHICYRFDAQSGWVEDEELTMKHARFMAAYVVSENGVVYIRYFR